MSAPSQPTRIDVAREVRARFGADYADAFRSQAVPGATARGWATRSLRGVDVAGGVFRRLVWGGVLGFRLARPGTPGTQFGWTIVREDPRCFELETDGPRMAGRMVFEVDAEAVTWTTLVTYHSTMARALWTPLSAVHRALVPGCLTRAAASLRQAARTAAPGPSPPARGRSWPTHP